MSFTDMMSSGRGPGVIGMLLALVVVAGFGLLFLFAFDDGLQGDDQSIESIIAHQAKDVDALKGGLARGQETLRQIPARTANAKEFDDLKRENLFRDGQIDGLKKSIAKANEEIESKTGEFEAYKDKYRAFVRDGAKGRKLERLETRDQRVYQNVVIREVSAVGMLIMHADGQKRIPYELLPDDMQEEFQFDAKQKEEALAQEAARRKRHEAAVTAAKSMAKERSEEQKEQHAAEEREQALRAIAAKRARIEILEREVETMERAIVAESRKTISHAPQMRQQLAAKQRELATLQSDVARLNSNF